MSASVQLPAVLRLREQIQRLEGVPQRARAVLPFGLAAIDSRLPGGGLALGALHEVAGGGNAAIDGAAAALFAAGLPPRATVSDMTIVPTDNQAWRSYAQAIAKG